MTSHILRRFAGLAVAAALIGGLLAAPLSAYARPLYSLNDSLVAYWAFDSSITADSLGANDLTNGNSGNCGLTTTNKLGGHSALCASASSQGLYHADNATFSPAGSFTVASWFQGIGGAYDSNYPVLWSHEASGSLGWSVYVDGSSHFACLNLSADGSASSTFCGNTAMSSATWYYVLIYYDNAGHTYGVCTNNSCVTGSWTGPVFDSTGAFTVGSYGNFGTDYCNCNIDELAYWSRTLTSGEMADLYNSGVGRAYSFSGEATNTPTVTFTPSNTPTPGPTGTPTVTPSTVTPTPTSTPLGALPSGASIGTGGGLTRNFWYWILNAITDFLLTFFLPFLPRHVDWGIAQVIAQKAGPILLIFYLGVGSFIHLATLFRIILLMLMMEGVKAILAYRKIVAKIIKYATLIGLLG